MLNKVTLMLFFIHVLFVVAYGYFFYEDLKQTLGLDSIELPFFSEGSVQNYGMSL